MITFEEIKLYDVQETAEVLKITPQTVRQIIKRGDLKAKRIGRPFYIEESELKEYMRRKQR